jgi:hypothetical protein
MVRNVVLRDQLPFVKGRNLEVNCSCCKLSDQKTPRSTSR